MKNPHSYSTFGSNGTRDEPARLLAWLALAAALIGSGQAVLSQPGNDHFADRIALTGTNVTLAGTTVGGTQEGVAPPNFPPRLVVAVLPFQNATWSAMAAVSTRKCC
jgi:hypothetical protein